MSLDTYIAIASLGVSAFTAACTVYISMLVLIHTAKPRVTVSLLGAAEYHCSQVVELRYVLTNKGHWYALPPAIDITVFCDFDPAFELIGLGYGSQQQVLNPDVRIGKGGRKYLKAKGIKLIHNDIGEDIVVHARTPATEGTFLSRITAYSANGLSLVQDFPLSCSG